MRKIWVACLPLLLASTAWAEIQGGTLMPAGPSDAALMAEAQQPVEMALFLRRIVRRIGSAVRRVARGVTRVVGGVARGVSRTVRTVVRTAGTVVRKVGSVARTVVRKVGTVVRKVGRTVGKVAKKVGRTVGKVVKKVGGAIKTVVRKAGRVVKTVVKKAGKVVKKVVKKVVEVAKKVGKAVLKGIKTLAQFVLKIGKWILEKVKAFLSSRLGQLVVKYLPKILEYASKVFGGNLKWLAALTKAVEVATKIQSFLNKYVAKPLEVIDSILTKRHYLDYARDPNLLINMAKEKIKTWVKDKIMGLIMIPVKKVGQELSKALIAFGLKIVKHPITTAIASWISAAVASFTAGIGAVLQPAIKWVIDQLMDRWAIPKLADMLVGKGIAKVEEFLRNKILPKYIDKPIDKIVDSLVSKYLQKWIDKYKAATGAIFDKVDNVLDKVQGVVDKIWAGLRMVDRVVDALKTLREAYKKTCKNVAELCRAIASDYQAAKAKVAGLKSSPEVVDAMMKVVLLRRSYAENNCQYGKYY